MARRNILKTVTDLASALVVVAVGFALTNGTIAVPVVGDLINQIAGWITVASGALQALSVFGLKVLK